MHSSFIRLQQMAAVAALLAAAALWSGATSAADDQSDKSLAQQIFETMLQAGAKPGFRLVHAKGVVCEGTFTASKDAATLSKAAHFQGASGPVTIRFSDGAPDPAIPDSSPNAGPRGMAIRFSLPGGGETDLVTMSHNGFAVSTGEDFLALQKAIVATDPSKPHPWPVEVFLGAHPLALKFVQENQAVPASFGTQSFFSNDAFVFVNKDGVKQAGRYKILPVAGQSTLSEADAKTKSPNFLVEELKTRLTSGPVKFRLIVQIPNAGDPTIDPALVWPDDRRTIELGTINVTSVVADSNAAEKALVFFPTTLTDGIELSDDPFPALRTSVYALSFAHRQQR